MNTHQVTLNGQPVATSRDHYRLFTFVTSYEHHDANGNPVTTHEFRMEGIDATGKKVTQFVPPTPLKKGDVIQIVIGENAIT